MDTDCTQGISSWVYHNNVVFRNAFCAICNLGDAILSANVFGLSEVDSSQNLTSNLTRVSRVITLDISNNLVCMQGSSDCRVNTRGTSPLSPWGYLAAESSEQCIRVPFASECSDIYLERLGPRNMSYDFLFSAEWTFRTSVPQIISVRNSIQPYIIYEPPVFSQLVFTDYGELSSNQRYTTDTDWMPLNNTLHLCYNGSILDSSTNQIYRHLRLSPSLLEVRYALILTATVFL